MFSQNIRKKILDDLLGRQIIDQTLYDQFIGLEDEDWPKITERMKRLEIEELPENVVVKKELIPDVFLRPEIVVVVEADEISKSKLHTAGQGDDGVGYSLRFPRLKEWDRQDKDPEGVTSVGEIRRLL